MNHPVASLEVVARAATGERVAITAQIGQAYRNDDGSWPCPIELPLSEFPLEAYSFCSTQTAPATA